MSGFHQATVTEVPCDRETAFGFRKGEPNRPSYLVPPLIRILVNKSVTHWYSCEFWAWKRIYSAEAAYRFDCLREIVRTWLVRPESFIVPTPKARLVGTSKYNVLLNVRPNRNSAGWVQKCAKQWTIVVIVHSGLPFIYDTDSQRPKANGRFAEFA